MQVGSGNGPFLGPRLERPRWGARGCGGGGELGCPMRRTCGGARGGIRRGLYEKGSGNNNSSVAPHPLPWSALHVHAACDVPRNHGYTYDDGTPYCCTAGALHHPAALFKRCGHIQIRAGGGGGPGAADRQDLPGFPAASGKGCVPWDNTLDARWVWRTARGRGWRCKARAAGRAAGRSGLGAAGGAGYGAGW